VADDFEQPDLRTKTRGAGGGSVYRHPHTGLAVPSVTSISGLIDKSSFLVPWGVKVTAEWVSTHLDELAPIKDPDAIVEVIKAGSRKIRDGGKDLGSLAHNTIEALCRGQQVDIPDEVQHHVAGWLEWCAHYVESFILVEETVWNHTIGYAGTMDVLARFKDGRNVLVDYKTGKDVHADAALQLNALAHGECLVSMKGERPLPQIDGLGVLHLPAPVMTATGRVSVRGKWSYRPVEFRDIEWRTFQALRFAHAWEKEWSKTAIGGKQQRPEGDQS
jgi:hypothetical protein